MRLRGATALAALLVVSPAGPLAGLLTPASAAPCAGHGVSGKWTTSSFPLPGTQYTQLVADPKDPKRLFASDGTSVVRSTDQGCTWTSVFGVSGPDTSAAPGGNASLASTAYYVASIVPTGGTAVYLTLAPSPYLAIAGTFGPTAPPVLVAASNDGGGTFTVTAPTANQPRCNTSALAAAPSSPKTLYLACHGAILLANFVPLPPIGGPSPGPTHLEPISSLEPVIYHSADAGASWERILQTGVPKPSVGLLDLHVDPFNPNELWGRVAINAAAQFIVIVHSVDAGKTWKTVYQSPPMTGIPTMLGLSVARPTRAAKTHLVAWGPQGAILSTDAGKKWNPLPTGPSDLYRAAFDATAARVAISTSKGVPCKAEAKVHVFDTARGKALSAAPVKVTPASSTVDVSVLTTSRAGAGTFTGVARVYPGAGDPAHTTACTLPVTPPPPAPLHDVTSAGLGATWTNLVVTYRS